MSQIRREQVDICPGELDTVIEACKEAGYEAKIVEGNLSRHGRSTGNQVVQITGHGIETWGEPVVELVQRGEQAEFVVDIHSNRQKNEAKFKGLKENVTSKYQKIKAIKASKKLGFTVANTQEDEEEIRITVRKFVS